MARDTSSFYSKDYQSGRDTSAFYADDYQAPPPPEKPGDFVSGIYSGANSFMSLMNYSKAAIGALTDNEEWMREGIKTAQGYEEKAAEYGKGRVTDWDNVNNASDFVDYFQYGLGTLVPYAAESVAAGVVGGVAGSAVAPGPGTITGTLGGMVAKQALKETIKQYTKKVTSKKAKEAIERKLRKNFKEYSTGKILPKNRALVESAMKRTSAKMGATMGSFSATLPIGQGDVASNMIEADNTLTKESAQLATGLAIPYAALDVLPEFVGISRLLNPAGGGMLKRAATGFVSQAPIEAITEVAQEEINIRTRAAHDPTFDPMGREAMVQRRESAILGGAGGGVFGAATGLMSKGDSDIKSIELDVASNIEQVTKSEFKDVADYNQTIVNGIYDSATELTGKPDAGKTGTFPIDPDSPGAESQSKLGKVIPDIGAERRLKESLEIDQELPIGQRIDQLYNEAVGSGAQAGGDVNQYILNGLYGRADRALNPNEEAELAGQFTDTARETESIIRPVDPADFDRTAVESELKNLYSRSKQLDTESRGQTVPNFIAASGGISTDEAISQGLDPADMRAMNKKGMPFNMPLFKKDGKTFDEVAELLGEANIQSILENMGAGDYQARGQSANAALDLVQNFVTGGEPVYMPDSEQQAFEADAEKVNIEGLIEQYEANLSEINQYDQVLDTQGQEAADDFFYNNRALDIYQEMVDTGEIDLSDVLYAGESVTADTQFDEKGESLSALIDEAAKVNPELAEKEFTRLVDESDADIAKGMYAIINGETDETTTEEETKRAGKGGAEKVQAAETEEKPKQELGAFPGTEKADLPEMLKPQSGLAEQDFVETDKTPEMLKQQSGEGTLTAADVEKIELPEAMKPQSGDGADVIDTGKVPEMLKKQSDAGQQEEIWTGTINGQDVEVNINPSEAQRESGNYQKGHIDVQGLKVSIETPKGVRRKPQFPPIAAHYGYIKDSIGAETEEGAAPHEIEQVDIFVSDVKTIPEENPIFIINQYIKGKFDEVKTVAGAKNEAEARKLYLDSYSKGWKGLKNIHELTIDEFQTWLDIGDMTAEYQPITDLGEFPGVETDLAGAVDKESQAKKDTEIKTKKDQEKKEVAAEQYQGKPDLLTGGELEADLFATEKTTPKATELTETAKADAQDVAAPALSDNNYSILNGKNISYDVEIEDTGEVVNYTEDAGQAMRNIDDRIQKLKALQGCIG